MSDVQAGPISAQNSQPANSFWRDIAGLDFGAVAQDIQDLETPPTLGAAQAAVQGELRA